MQCRCRAVHILPNRMLGDVGRHSDLPLENLSLSRCGCYLASCSHDSHVRFWNVESVKTQTVDTSRKAVKTKRPKLEAAAKNRDFFADLETSAGTSNAGVSNGDDDSDDDDGGSGDGDSDDVGSDDNENKCDD